MTDALLNGVRVVTTAVNLPGPVAASRLRALGAQVTKIEPLSGDPFQRMAPAWYAKLADGQEVQRLDLKDPAGRAALDAHLAEADLLLTSLRPSSLERLGLGWERLHAAHPRLAHVAIIGHAPPHEERAGHDLTYQAQIGLVAPPRMPSTLLADLAGAERAVSTSLALLLAAARGGAGERRLVSLEEAAAAFIDPLRYGVTRPGALLGGGIAEYNIYETAQGWVALAALETHLFDAVKAALGLTDATVERLQEVFRTRPAEEWERWAADNGLPISMIVEPKLDVPVR
jgi:crotonobetainyl-CoA:carnitine CoA-transferase CaiB-like acyl-CoA transferase